MLHYQLLLLVTPPRLHGLTLIATCALQNLGVSLRTRTAGSAAKVTSSDEEDDDDARRSSGGNGGSASGGGGDLGHRCCIQSCVLGTGPVLVACTALVPSEWVALDCKL